MSLSHSVKILPAAEHDLDHLYRMIALDKPGAARRFVKNLKKAILSLKSFPRRGSRCDVIQDEKFMELRFLLHEGHMIFYDIRGRDVVVLRIIGPGKDWMSLFV